MAGEEILARGKVVLEVESNIKREMAQAEAAFKRGMERIDGEEATLRLNVKTKDYYAKLKASEKGLS